MPPISRHLKVSPDRVSSAAERAGVVGQNGLGFPDNLGSAGERGGVGANSIGGTSGNRK